MHNAFIGKEDEMKKLTDMCRANGIAVVGYYSLNYNTWAHDEYPEWRMIERDGCSKRDKPDNGANVSFENAGGRRYGLCCPNNEDYLNFVYAQIDEMLDFFTPDALFFDMLFWPHHCFCKHCEERWKKETGIDGLPRSFSEDDPIWRKHYERRSFWMGEYAEKVTAHVHKRAPHITVEHNVSAAAKGNYMGTATKVNDACEFAGGDLSGGLLEESVTCKLYSGITKNQPFEYMFPKCEPSLYKHTLTKTDDHIEAAVFLTAAHHGATPTNPTPPSLPAKRAIPSHCAPVPACTNANASSKPSNISTVIWKSNAPVALACVPSNTKNRSHPANKKSSLSAKTS
jgi:hypothetical protein